MISPDAILAGADWPSLSHAYGDAGDLPARLVALLSGDPETAGDALAMLDAAVLHQGSIYSSTAPVALFVAAIAGDPRTLLPCTSALPWADRTRPLRAALLEWLGQVAESASWGEPEPPPGDPGSSDLPGSPGGPAWSGGPGAPGEPGWSGEAGPSGISGIPGEMGTSGISDIPGGMGTSGELFGEGEDDDEERAVAACREIRHELYRIVALYVEDPDPAIRSAAVGAAGHLLIAPELAEYRPAAADRLQHEAPGQGETDRANTALTLARWGIAPATLLDDPSAGVRAHAALAAALDDDPRALAEVRSALRDPAAADQWLPDTLLDGRLRFALVRALLRRTRDFAAITAEALAIAGMTSQYTVDNDWGPLIQRAFPTPYAGSLTPAQRAFLTALAANIACWGSNGNRISWLHRAGLPSERAALQSLLAAST